MAHVKIPIQNHQRMAVQTAMIRALYASGMLAVGILAPKMTKMFPVEASKVRRNELYQRLGDARRRLKQRGLIEEDGGKMRLTEKGRTSIERILMHEYRIPEPIRWDGKWRVLIFDIKERRRAKRAELRALLRGAGFVLLQDSVWVHPYPCDEFVGLIRAHLASGVGELRSIVAEALESDRPLRSHFELD